MAPKDLTASAESLGEKDAPGRVLPPGALHIGPGKSVALLMILADVIGLLLAFALGAWAADLTRELLTGVSCGGRRGSLPHAVPWIYEIPWPAQASREPADGSHDPSPLRP